MKKEAKEMKVEVQKGRIEPDQPNYKYMTPEACLRQDNEWMEGRCEGKELKFHTPKR